jgi:hypothetical protein
MSGIYVYVCTRLCINAFEPPFFPLLIRHGNDDNNKWLYNTHPFHSTETDTKKSAPLTTNEKGALRSVFIIELINTRAAEVILQLMPDSLY